MSPSGFRFFVCADVFSFHIVTPQKFEIALRQAKAFADAHPKQVPLITLNAERSTIKLARLAVSVSSRVVGRAILRRRVQDQGKVGDE